MKKIYSLALLVAIGSSSLYATNLKKIEEGETLAPINEKSAEKGSSKSEGKDASLTLLNLKSYEVDYDKSLLNYSILKNNKEGFKEYVADKKIPAYTVKKLFGSADTKDSTLVSAYGYDLNYQRPDLAENFYLLIGDKYQVEIRDKIKKADFLLRTGRPEQISEILSKRDCMSSLNYQHYCYYYLGLKEFLTSGDNKNIFLQLSKTKVKKAEEIYNQK